MCAELECRSAVLTELGRNGGRLTPNLPPFRAFQRSSRRHSGFHLTGRFGRWTRRSAPRSEECPIAFARGGLPADTVRALTPRARGRRETRSVSRRPKCRVLCAADLPGNSRDALDRGRGSRGGTHSSGGTRTRRTRGRPRRRARRARHDWLARRSHRSCSTVVIAGVLRITRATIFATGTTELGPRVTVRVEVAVGVRVGLRRGRSRGHPTDGDRQRGGCHHADKHLLHVASLLWRFCLPLLLPYLPHPRPYKPHPRGEFASVPFEVISAQLLASGKTKRRREATACKLRSPAFRVRRRAASGSR